VLGREALNGPPSGGRMREDVFPPLAISEGDEGEFTGVVLDVSKRFPSRFASTDVARCFALVPLTVPGPKLHFPSRYSIDWGASPETNL